jgi:DNA polymerase III alpha subunit
MIHIALLTEYSYKKCYLHMKDVHKYVHQGCVGIADINTTQGHIPFMKESDKHGFKPIYGVRLSALPDGSKQRMCNTHWVFIAKNNDGLKELYELVAKAYDNFYYIPKLNYSDVKKVSSNIVKISPLGMNNNEDYVAYGPANFGPVGCSGAPIYIDYNNFPTVQDEKVYQLLAGSRKHGASYINTFDSAVTPRHILSKEEVVVEYGDSTLPLWNAEVVASNCTAQIPKADMVKWDGDHDIRKHLRMDKIKNWTDEYSDRLEYEIKLIEDKGYVDYFLIVADMIIHAKKTMLVGPSRGSSAGSLVCYLLDITEVDPIEHGLIFERFIDVNRFDLPDIDIDFPDTLREGVIEYLKRKYGRHKVMCLANTSRLKPKSAIGEFAKALGIPPYETDRVKGAIIERSGGDARAAMCITDTFETTDAGKDFIRSHPEMDLVKYIEGHASHSGKHAAGILVGTLPLSTYGSMDNRAGVIQMDKKDAEYIGLLKIDCLGLRNLTILQETAKLIGVPYKAFYSLRLDDQKTFDLFNSMRLSGVFQFEGQALQIVVKQMGVKNFNDISAITALARPGALNSGGTARYIKYALGNEEPEYFSAVHKDITEETMGIVVYQEQMMEIARRIGGLSWADTSELRRAASKSLGDEFFNKYKERFIEGAMKDDYTEQTAEILWNDISSSGSWSFNKAHAVSYGLVSYWTAYCKAHHPMEFAVASLNNAASVENAIKLLRDLKINEGIEYVAVDSDKSKMDWSTDGVKLIGGLSNIKGIGEAKAKQILKARDGSGKLTPSLFKALSNPVTDFDILFPCEHYWGHLYNDPITYRVESKPHLIKDVSGIGTYIIIGKLVDRNVRDLNEHIFLTKRDNQIIEKDNLYLNFKVEDDTDMIGCKISRFKYESFGRAVAEQGRIGLDWYMVKGKITSEWRKLDVIEIVNLNKYFPDIGKTIK